MSVKINPQTGTVYFLKDYTAPKVYNGLYFQCLLTDQKIPANAAIKSDLGLLIHYKGEVWNKERFGLQDTQKEAII